MNTLKKNKCLDEIRQNLPIIGMYCKIEKETQDKEYDKRQNKTIINKSEKFHRRVYLYYKPLVNL